MAWLVADGRVLASLEVADGHRGRARGLLGRDGIDGALLLSPARSVHTFRMRFAIDVAYCDAEMRVIRLTHMTPNRLGAPVWRSRCIVEAEAGSFERWGLNVGQVLEVRHP